MVTFVKKSFQIILPAIIALLLGFESGNKLLYGFDSYTLSEEIEVVEDSEDKSGDWYDENNGTDGGDDLPDDVPSISFIVTPVAPWTPAFFKASPTNICFSSQYPMTFSRPGFFILYGSFKSDLA